MAVGVGLAGCAGPPESVVAPAVSPAPRSSDLLPEPLKGDRFAVTVHRLSNGLTVYLSPEPNASEVTAWFTVRAGSSDDPAEATGLAHYLEHMLFMGTRKIGAADPVAEAPHLQAIAEAYAQLRGATEPRVRSRLLATVERETRQAATYVVAGEYRRALSELGVQGADAMTREEATFYYASVPASRLHQWLTIEAERFSDPVFRLFAPELRVVREEKAKDAGNPWVVDGLAVRRGLFPAHPYAGHPLGTDPHLDSPAYRRMVEFFERWYTPQNMALALCGPLDAKTLIPQLEATLGRIPARAAPTRTTPPPAPIQGRVAVEVTAPGPSRLTLAWRTMPTGHPDEVVIPVLDWLLTRGADGLLSRALGPESSSGSELMHFSAAGYWQFFVDLPEGEGHESTERKILSTLEQVRRGEFDDSHLQAVLEAFERREKWAVESPTERVVQMARTFAQGLSWVEAVDRKNRATAVTKADVVRVANTYFGSDFVAVHRRSGPGATPQIGSSDPEPRPLKYSSRESSAFIREVLAQPQVPAEPRWLQEGRDYEIAQLPPGALVTSRNLRSDLFELHYVWDRGAGRSEALCLALDIAQSQLGPNSNDRGQALLPRGVEARVVCDARSSRLQLEGVDADADASVAAVRQWLRALVVSRPEVEAALVRARRAGQETSALARGLELARAAHSGDVSTAPRRADPGPSPTPERVEDILTDHFRRPHRTLYFGPRSGAELGSSLGLELGGSGPVDLAEADSSPTPVSRTRPAIYLVPTDAPEASVSIVGARIPAGPGAVAMARVFDIYFGGRLFEELRESRGLLYVASGRLMLDRRHTSFALETIFPTRPRNVVPAIRAYFELLAAPLDESRLEDAIRNTETDYRNARISPRAVPAQVDAWRARGHRADPRPAEFEALRGLDTTTFAAEFERLTAAPPTIVIVGSVESIDRAELRALGSVIELPADP